MTNEEEKLKELSYTKEEIKDYIKCCYMQIYLIARDKFSCIMLSHYTLTNKPITDKANFLVEQILQRTKSEKMIKTILNLNNKIYYFTGLLELV